MKRRDFLSGFSKASLAATATAAIGATVMKGKQAAEKSVDAAAGQYQSLAKRVDKLEVSQAKMMRALIVVTAVSTGIDLSLIDWPLSPDV